MSGQSYRIYNGLYAVAHAMHAMSISRQRTVLNKGKAKHLNIDPWQVHSSSTESCTEMNEYLFPGQEEVYISLKIKYVLISF